MSHQVTEDLKQFSAVPCRYSPHPVYDHYGRAVSKQEAANELKKVLSKLNWNNPAFPIYTNVTGTAIPDALSLAEIMPKAKLILDNIENIRKFYDDNKDKIKRKTETTAKE